ncbi:DNA-directed RNA polymerase III subunit RPC4 isoform X1 [Anabrus simplex]|uniref:DNA-directed RNA polymerase III subunit RPC4 isoform X1 n=1 Tax=Anabrus simplex TaxID=316456 RepID=UPI0034DD9FCA
MSDRSSTTGSALSPSRLASFRGLRDLSLGMPVVKTEPKSRKTYIPNLNVRRNKIKEEEFSKEVSHRRGENKRGHGRGFSRGGRGRDVNNLIQETGSVFAEGTAILQNRRYGGDGGYSDSTRGGSNFIPMPKLNLQHDRKVNKEEEDLKLRELLRDDFLDDPGLEPDGASKPVQLPFHAADVAPKKEVKSEVKTVKKEIVIDGVKIKQEPVDEGPKTKMELEDDQEEVEDPELNERTVAEFFRRGATQMFFLQLPDALPGLKQEVNSGPARPSTSKPSSARSTETSESSTEQARLKDCTLGSLSDGYIGKIQLLRSGKARLILNDCTVHLASSLQTGCREDVISVELDPATHTGEMINLGPVDARLLCSPYWEDMLSRPEA